MVSLLPTKFHEILFSSFRGVALTNCDGQTDKQHLQNIHIKDRVRRTPHKTGLNQGAPAGTLWYFLTHRRIILIYVHTRLSINTTQGQRHVK
jgi:hypothetical protein